MKIITKNTDEMLDKIASYLKGSIGHHRQLALIVKNNDIERYLLRQILDKFSHNAPSLSSDVLTFGNGLKIDLINTNTDNWFQARRGWYEVCFVYEYPLEGLIESWELVEKIKQMNTLEMWAVKDN